MVALKKVGLLKLLHPVLRGTWGCAVNPMAIHLEVAEVFHLKNTTNGYITRVTRFPHLCVTAHQSFSSLAPIFKSQHCPSAVSHVTVLPSMPRSIRNSLHSFWCNMLKKTTKKQKTQL